MIDGHPDRIADGIADGITRDLAAVGNLSAVPKLLDIVCIITGMRFAAVTRIGDHGATACAVKDELSLGVAVGGPLDLESYQVGHRVSVPIMMPGGRHFGQLCAIDPAAANVSDPRNLAVFGAIADIIGAQLDTELKREQDRHSWRDARAAGELRDNFLAILGHDLRNPLQAISSTATLLERRLSDSALIGMASRIRSNVRRMSALIDDVLDFARGRLDGGIGVDIKPCADLESALVSVVEELQDGSPGRQIVLDASVTQPVDCDLVRLQQVLSNLVGNAITHGAVDTPIKVTVRNNADDLVVEVCNHGGLGLQDEGTRFTMRVPLRAAR